MLRKNELTPEEYRSAQGLELKQFPVSQFKNFLNWLVEYLPMYSSITLAFLIVCVSVLFAPLVLAGFEYFILGTSHIEGLFRTIQLHEPLGRLYEPIIDQLRRLFNF